MIKQMIRLGVVGVWFLLTVPSVHAQVVAPAVEQKSWVIDADTALKGITLENGGTRVKLGFAPAAFLGGTRVEIATFASEHYVNGGEYHRITPIYRVIVEGNPEAVIPIEIRHQAEDLGKKALWIWGEDDIWRDLDAQSVPEKSLLRAKISTGTTYLAVFSHNQVLEKGLASWYKYKNCHCAASPDYPKGTRLKVTNLDSGKSVAVKVNDFGPDRLKYPDRVLDLDLAAFRQLAGKRKGLVRVKVEPI